MELAIFSGPAFPVTLYGPTNDRFVSALCCCRGDRSNCGYRLCSLAGKIRGPIFGAMSVAGELYGGGEATVMN